jgi:hypothetical protein
MVEESGTLDHVTYRQFRTLVRAFISQRNDRIQQVGSSIPAA